MSGNKYPKIQVKSINMERYGGSGTILFPVTILKPFTGGSKNYTRSKTTAGKIQEITFNKGGYVKKDKHGKEL